MPLPGAAAGGGVGASFFEPAGSFAGARPGKVFKLGHLGLGYYADTAAAEADNQLPELRLQLPEKWRACSSLRQERLRVDPARGAGLSLEHCEFGFAVTSVEAVPGQQLQDGDVIVAMEGRILAGLSAPQMQASFQKRRVDGARMQVASKQELEYLLNLDPAIVECWDAANQRVYYFHKKTGRSGWTREELSAAAAEASTAGSASSSASKPPIDLANFLQHGFAKPKEPPAKPKKRKADAKSGADAQKDESDLAREERKRWKDWNEGERGGYTEQFLEKYKHCQSNPAKPKADKRLKGSVGPGQGMEYMARWTGSKNSFN